MRFPGIAGVSALPICVVLTGLATEPNVMLAQTAEQQNRLEQILREEGEAVLQLADLAAAGKRVPSDFRVQWQHVFLKAQKGTFIPFTLTVDTRNLARPSVLVYVRAVRRDLASSGESRAPPRSTGRASQGEDVAPADAVFPVEFRPEDGQPARIHRGLSLPSGVYDFYVVVRERVDPGDRRAPWAAVLTERVDVPDLWQEGLTTSSVILADRIAVLTSPLAGDELAERPFVIGQHEVTPAANRTFRRDEELIVVFLIYNPFVTTDGRFDVQVEYHFFRRGRSEGDGREPGVPGQPPAREGEHYFNHTDPQRFTPVTLGAGFDPGAGQPVLAGQGVPLRDFERGEYRLAIRVTDRLAGRSVLRDVEFTVGP